MLNQNTSEGDNLGHHVGDHYVIHDQTAKVLNNINRRLTEEDKTLRTYRRALAFSEIIKKDLVPILISSFDNLNVFSAVVRLLVNLTVPVECLCPLEVLSKTEVGLQTVTELTNSLLRTKEVFCDRRTTRGILEMLTKYSSKDKDLNTDEVGLVTNCLLLVRNILHVPDVEPSRSPRASKKCSYQNQIMWNLFAQNLDKAILDLIAHRNNSAWCTSLAQLVALVYKDQHVVTLQKLLQSFLEASLSESSEDNESNTSPRQFRSCSPSSHEFSDQNSRDTSSPERASSRPRRDSCGSLNVLPTNSPAPSFTDPPTPMSINMSLPSPSMAAKEEEENENFISPPQVIMTTHHQPKEENTSSGIDSEIFSTPESEPPHKMYVSENDKGEQVLIERHSPENKEFVHKQRRTDKMLVPSNAPRRFANKSSKNIQVSSSSDNSDVTGIPKKPKSPKSNTTTVDSSDYGYVTNQIVTSGPQDLWTSGTQEMSSSSNEDEQQKPPRTNPVKPRAQAKTNCSPVDKNEKHRQKLLKRSRENRMRVKAMVNHVPDDKDISELLKEFTVDFLHNGYSALVVELLDKLSKKECDLAMDKSHFLWLLTYFLKFASQLEVGLDQIGSVISFRTLSYITYEGVELLETLELAYRKRSPDVTGHVRRLHLVVTALREFIQTFANYGEIKNLAFNDKKHLKRLQLQCLYTKDIRQLLVLLLRSFNPQIQSLQYLSDLVICNHMLLMDLESGAANDELRTGPPLDMTKHMAQFAEPELMRQYGRLLEGFQANTPFLNDCIFTVMHHIAGDLNSPHNLYLPTILKSFSKIWEQGLQICEDWVDLIEYIIQKFIQTMGSNPHTCVANMVECLDYSDVADEFGFTGFQTSKLFYHFTQVENSSDPVGSLIEIYKETDNLILSRLVVIQALLAHGVITHATYMNFIYMKNVINSKTEKEGSVIAEVGSEHCTSDGHITDNEDSMDIGGQEKEIQVLKSCLVSQGKASLIPWLQEVLLDACRVKMYQFELEPQGSDIPQEPISFYYNKAKQSIPLVPWNRFQYQGLQSEAFILLLHKLGFHLPADVGKIYPRIPHFWSADHIYSVATKLGPIPEGTLKFSLEELERITDLPAEDKMGGMLETSLPRHHDRSPMSFMNNMNDNFDSMDLLEEPKATGPKAKATWSNLAAVSKFVKMEPISRTPMKRRRENWEQEVASPTGLDDDFMDMI